MKIHLRNQTGHKYYMGNFQGTIVKDKEIKPRNDFGSLHIDIELPQDDELIRNGIPLVNYIVCDSFYDSTTGRSFEPRYFIDKITTHGGMMTLYCTLDVLNVYASEIKESKAVLTRTSSPRMSGGTQDPRLSNNTWVYDLAKLIYTMSFENGGFFTYDSPSKVMVTIKGNK